MEKKIKTVAKMKSKMENSKEIQERAQRLKFLRSLTRLSMKEFAQRCNIGLTTINYWEQGYSSITERGAKKVSHAMREEGIECSSIWLLSGLGAPPKITNPTKLSKLNFPEDDKSLNRLTEANYAYLYKNIQEELEAFQKVHPENLVCLIEDDSMKPLYNKGDIVAGIKLTSKNMELANGLDCIVEFEENKLLVRRIRFGRVIDGFDFYVINSEASLDHPPLWNVTPKSLAPIIRVWKTKKIKL